LVNGSGENSKAVASTRRPLALSLEELRQIVHWPKELRRLIGERQGVCKEKPPAPFALQSTIDGKSPQQSGRD
jgi:hypothetical protein